MLQGSILCTQGTQYAPSGSILCRGAFCGSTKHVSCIFTCINETESFCFLKTVILIPILIT